MSKNAKDAPDQKALDRRVELARRAFREFYVQCFWSWQEDPEITEETIPLIVRALRIHGGDRGYEIAAELCR